jgi:hypothetical protein
MAHLIRGFSCAAYWWARRGPSPVWRVCLSMRYLIQRIFGLVDLRLSCIHSALTVRYSSVCPGPSAGPEGFGPNDSNPVWL